MPATPRASQYGGGVTEKQIPRFARDDTCGVAFQPYNRFAAAASETVCCAGRV